MVSVEVAPLEPGVIVAGANEQLRLLASPVHDRAIGLLKAPDCGFAVTVKCPACPAGIVMADGDAANATVTGATTQDEL